MLLVPRSPPFIPPSTFLRALKSKATGLVDFSLWPASSLTVQYFFFPFFFLFFFSFIINLYHDRGSIRGYRRRGTIFVGTKVFVNRISSSFLDWQKIFLPRGKMVGEEKGGRNDRIDRRRDNGFVDRCYAAHGNS